MQTVLVVEDDEDIRDLFVTILSQGGYHVIAAENGRAALDELKKLKGAPCLVLLDMMMPVMNGPEFVEALDHCHKLASLPVVIVSAHTDASAKGHVRKVVKKPVAPDLLKQVVAEFCSVEV
jgi:CheY-like chemotaxis protein